MEWREFGFLFLFSRLCPDFSNFSACQFLVVKSAETMLFSVALKAHQRFGKPLKTLKLALYVQQSVPVSLSNYPFQK